MIQALSVETQIPSISVVMPIRGAAPFLQASLDSIMRQSLQVSELIIIDDGMDALVHTVLEQINPAQLTIIILPGPKKGPAAARNVGLAAAKGDWLTFLDDDDLWPDNKLSSQAQYLQEHPEVMAVSGKIQWFHAWDQQLQPVPSDQDQIIVHVNLGAYLLRRELLDRIGPLDPDLIFSEDVDFVLRLIDGGHSFAILPQVMLLYRRHEQSMTAQKLEREKIDYRKVLFASLKRRRHQVATKLEDYVVKA